MSDGGSQTASKEPWSEAAPWLKENIAQGRNLQAYYQQNPWNAQQQQAYQNTFTDLDNFRNVMAPGLMDFANRLMGTNYSRHGSSGIPMGSMMQTKPQAANFQSGLLGGGQSGPFSAPKGQSYGLLDFNALNPYDGALKPDEIKKPTQQTIEEAVQAEIDRRRREAEQASGSNFA